MLEMCSGADDALLDRSAIAEVLFEVIQNWQRHYVDSVWRCQRVDVETYAMENLHLNENFDNLSKFLTIHCIRRQTLTRHFRWIIRWR